MMMSSKLQTVVDLAKAGYVEEEFLVSRPRQRLRLGR